MRKHCYIPLLFVLFLLGCSKEKNTVDEEKLFKKVLTFTSNISTTKYEVINIDSKQKIASGDDIKPTSQQAEKDGYRYVYNQEIKVKAGEKLRLILPLNENRKYITIHIGGVFSGLSSIIPEKIQYLDFKMDDKLYD
ncbi:MULTISPECIES: hypothetical protein [Sphingobacterium]|uniref:hypothetical protein n=1 Tax=Sphingobacterium TaxID=28453 RepID=UPI00257C855C|nr:MULTISPECIES: hypothetical protein [Sphingobacterium]